MHRFYLTQRIETNDILISDPEQLHHLRDVLRLKTGNEVIVFDSGGNEYLCSIKQISREQVILTNKERRPAKTRQIKIAVVCAIPKMAKMDEIIDALTQLGADRIIPIETERAVVKLDESRKAIRLKRWRKIARNAAEQSQRSSVPLVEPITAIQTVLSHSRDFDLKLILTLSGERKHMKEILAEYRPENILILIGPEGDFTEQEVALAKSVGFVPVSLGDYVLRVGIAAIAVVSYIMLSLSV